MTSNRARRPPTLLSVAAAVTLIACLAAPTAPAKIVVDPEGPAAKQYSAPLERARADASGGDSPAGVPGSAAKAPLFGEGTRPGAPDRAGGGAGGQAAGTPTSLGATGRGGAALLLVAISIAVLALGALLALGARFGARRLSA